MAPKGACLPHTPRQTSGEGRSKSGLDLINDEHGEFDGYTNAASNRHDSEENGEPGVDLIPQDAHVNGYGQKD